MLLILLMRRKQLYSQNSLLIIYDDKWFEPSHVASRLFCTSVGTIPLYGKTCVRRTLRGEVLGHPRSRCGVRLRCRYLSEFGICRYVSCRLWWMVGEWCLDESERFPAQGDMKHRWFCHLVYLLSKNNACSLHVITVVLLVCVWYPLI